MLKEPGFWLFTIGGLVFFVLFLMFVFREPDDRYEETTAADIEFDALLAVNRLSAAAFAVRQEMQREATKWTPIE